MSTTITKKKTKKKKQTSGGTEKPKEAVSLKAKTKKKKETSPKGMTEEQLERLHALDERTTKKRMDIARAEYSDMAQVQQKLEDIDGRTAQKRMEIVHQEYLSIGQLDKRRQQKDLEAASKEFMMNIHYQDFLHRQQVLGKINVGENLMRMLHYTDKMKDIITLMQDKMVKAKDFNKAFGALSVAQIALGAAAIGLGITLIVISCGAAAPVVAGAALALGTAATTVSATGAVIGTVGSVAQGKRNAIVENKSSKKKIAKAVLVSGRDTGIEEGIGQSVPRLALLASGGDAMVAGVASSGFGALGGAYAVGQGGKALNDAKKFSPKELYTDSRDDWAAHHENLRRFLRGLRDAGNPYVDDWKAHNSIMFDKMYQMLYHNMADLMNLQRMYDPK